MDTNDLDQSEILHAKALENKNITHRVNVGGKQYHIEGIDPRDLR
jgi:hypothetical protein